MKNFSLVLYFVALGLMISSDMFTSLIEMAEQSSLLSIATSVPRTSMHAFSNALLTSDPGKLVVSHDEDTRLELSLDDISPYVHRRNNVVVKKTKPSRVLIHVN